MSRTRGALGKNKAFLLNRLQSMYGKDFDPVMKMAEQAVTLDQLASEEPSGIVVSRQVKRYDGSVNDDAE